MTKRSDFRNATKRMKDYISSPDFIDLDRIQVHQRLLKLPSCISKEPVEVDEAVLDYIHDRILMHHRARAVSNNVYYAYYAEKKEFERNIWPKVYAKAKYNPSMVQFLLEFAVFSDYIVRFLVNVWECPAKAVLPAHGIAENMLGEPEVIPVTDPMFPFCYDQSYRMIQYRTLVPQEAMKKAKRIFFAGGGLVPELFTNGYPLGESGQEYVVYDQDENLPGYLEQILGGPLEKYNIKYHIGNFEKAFTETGHTTAYDMVVANGVEAYRLPQLADDMKNFRKMLSPGGKIAFDLQLSHPVLMFDVATLAWPQGMATIGGADTARQMTRTALEGAGFVDIDSTTEPYDEGGAPAGLITVATAG